MFTIGIDMNVVYKTVVGSQMHGLATPESDHDVRYITMHSIKEVLSPFKNNTIKVQDSDGDVESWELCHFVKHLSQGNPTCYEVIKSPLYEYTGDFYLAYYIRELYPFVFDGHKCLMAHCGYAEAQLARYLRKFSDPELVMQDNQFRRTKKATVAAYRVIAQCEQLLTTGDFEPVVKDYSVDLHDKLMAIKSMSDDEVTAEFCAFHNNEIESEIKNLKALFNTLPENVQNQKPNIEELEERLYLLYKLHDQRRLDAMWATE
jgi:predicted nucleotidyltransferase